MSDVVIRVENLSKVYRLGTISHGTLYQDMQSAWAKIRGTEDPNAKIDTVSQEQLNNTNDRFCALKDVTFDVRQGEIIGIIGRNGAGKSTLLKIISRVTAPSSGSIKVKGRVASLLEIGTGFHPELTGRENIFLNGAILGMRRAEIEQKFDEIIKFAEIDPFIDTPVKRYSSGMYVRLAFGVAAHLDPDILVVDEVLAVGDAGFQKKCLGKMGDVAKGGRTVLFVSHNMSAIQNLCERSLLIEHGSIKVDGKSKSVIQEYIKSVRSGYIYNPQPTIGYTDIVIKHAILTNEKGQETDTFRPGERISIKIEYNALNRIICPNFWITIRGPFGELFGANMLYDGACPDFIEGHGVISCIFSGFRLLPQPYSIMLGIRHKNAYNNYIPATEIGTFFIVGTALDYNMQSEHAENFFQTFYSLVVPYEWHLPNGQIISVNETNRKK